MNPSAYGIEPGAIQRSVEVLYEFARIFPARLGDAGEQRLVCAFATRASERREARFDSDADSGRPASPSGYGSARGGEVLGGASDDLGSRTPLPIGPHVQRV